MSKILVVIDMQKDFVTGCLGSPEAAAILPRVVKTLKEFDGEVIFTRDTHQANYLDTQEGKNLPVVHCVEGTEGWQLMDALEQYRLEHGSRVLDKVTFGSRDLGEALVKINEQEPIESITFIGVCTDICVISNVMLVKAFLPEVPLIVDSACCAGVTPQSHENALNAMRVCQVKII